MQVLSLPPTLRTKGITLRAFQTAMAEPSQKKKILGRYSPSFRSRSRSSDWRTAYSGMGCQIPPDRTMISCMLLSIYNNTFDRSNPLNHIVSCILLLNTTNATCLRRVMQNDGSFFFGGQLKCADLRCGRKTSGSLQSITAGYAFDVENLENLPRRVM